MEQLLERGRRFVERMTVKLDFRAAFAEIHDYVREQPGQVAPLLMACLDQYSAGGTCFDAGLSFVSESEFGELVERSVALLSADRGHPAAQRCVAHAALQVPGTLQPHLSELFRLRPNHLTYYACSPWRAAGAADIAFLREVAADGARAGTDRAFAWRCLLATADRASLTWAALHPPPSIALPVEPFLDEAGFDAAEGSLRPLYSPACFHLRFADSYIADFGDPEWRPKGLEPTWVLDGGPAHSYRLGGLSTASCASCGGALHRMLDLDPVPAGIGVSLDRLDLVTCLSCLGWAREALFFQHEADGRVVPLPCGEPISPEFPSGPLQETTVSLALTPPRWQRQDWGSSNGRENLHRVAGHPTWIQSAQYPECPECSRKMHFLMQLDSDLALADGGRWQWGSGGIGYFYWCDGCRISGGLWQCT